MGDVFSMIAYVLGDPYLFIGSTTVMTTGLILGSAVLAATAAVPFGRTSFVQRTAEWALAWLAPKLALVLAYFGIGSMALATEIFIRYYTVFPSGTEMQLRSGIGHLAVAAIGILLLRPHLSGLTRSAWVEAHFWALAYLTFQVLVLTPPWFDFEFQGDLVLGIARGALAAALGVNLVLWHRWK